MLKSGSWGICECYAMQTSEEDEDEDAKRLIKDIRGLKHRCQALEAEADSLGVTNCELQTALADKEQQLQQQRGIIVDLEATINAQSSDIRTALQLVRPQSDPCFCNLNISKSLCACMLAVALVAACNVPVRLTCYDTDSQGDCSDDSPCIKATHCCNQVTRSTGRAEREDTSAHDLVPARHAHGSPCKATLRHESVQRGSNSLHCHNADIPIPQRQGRGLYSPSRSCHAHSSSMDVLCRDMQQLDAQIADLDLNLASASHRLHY